MSKNIPETIVLRDDANGVIHAERRDTSRTLCGLEIAVGTYNPGEVDCPDCLGALHEPAMPPATPPRVPDQPGLWWLGNRPVFVDNHGEYLVFWHPRSSLAENVEFTSGWEGPCLTPAEQARRLGALASKYDKLENEALQLKHYNNEDRHSAKKHAIHECATALGITLPGGEGK